MLEERTYLSDQAPESEERCDQQAGLSPSFRASMLDRSYLTEETNHYEVESIDLGRI